MPILEISVVGDPPDDVRPLLARRLADAAGAVFHSSPSSTWVRLTVVPQGDYAENGASGEDGPAPVFVRVLKRDPPRGASLKEEVERLVRAMASVCGRDPSLIHVLYEPPLAGRMAFGGRVVE